MRSKWLRGAPTRRACEAWDVLEIAFGAWLIDEPAGDRTVSVDAAVAQEGPVAANVFHLLGVDFADQDLLFVVRGFGKHHAEGIAEERTAPELKPRALHFV